ncbi:WD repeat-containing protein JIP5 [Coprinopsis cinerea okayama7|uniref:WD repeat-containing protein JIP5 n=1 Tax=Rhizoctonia solani TaxID=456999 RepID=A0A0K6FXH9_9AGAM|nr:WD repeat-containing protein JIP5 [Coprinopsis cinerea okayama7\
MKFGFMPDVDLGSQVFDLAFNPKHDIVYTGLLNGHIKAFAYDDQGTCTSKFDIRPTKRSARSLGVDQEGLELYSVSKDRSIHAIDTSTGKVVREQAQAHESAINRVTRFMSMLATGDDNGVVKLWDPRQITPIRSYTHHFDFISDFLWLQDKKQLVTTSGDGTLSVIDVRSSKVEPFAHSEDQEDELLSIVSIKDGKKVAVGTQTGVISIWNRSSGWADCVDRLKGHPHSVDALATLSEDVIVTGSSDGLVRVVQVLPNELLGVIADHGTFPVERLRTDRNGAWLGSASHDDVLKLTDVRDALVDSDEDDSDKGESDDSKEEGESDDGIDNDSDSGSEEGGNENEPVIEQGGETDESDSDSDKSETRAESDSEPEPQPEPEPVSTKKRKKNQPEGPSNKKGKVDSGFFDEL